MQAHTQVQSYLATEKDTLDFSTQLANSIDDTAGITLYLSGCLGAGKTTFARGFLRGLGYQGKVKSPTYTLVEPYEIAGKKWKQCFHFDFYRLNHAEELLDMGLQEYFQSDTICLIEWPEKGSPFLPPADLVCQLVLSGEGRKLNLAAQSVQGEKIISRL